jgi:hypothetical protein
MPSLTLLNSAEQNVKMLQMILINSNLSLPYSRIVTMKQSFILCYTHKAVSMRILSGQICDRHVLVWPPFPQAQREQGRRIRSKTNVPLRSVREAAHLQVFWNFLYLKS